MCFCVSARPPLYNCVDCHCRLLFVLFAGLFDSLLLSHELPYFDKGANNNLHHLTTKLHFQKLVSQSSHTHTPFMGSCFTKVFQSAIIVCVCVCIEGGHTRSQTSVSNQNHSAHKVVPHFLHSYEMTAIWTQIATKAAFRKRMSILIVRKRVERPLVRTSLCVWLLHRRRKLLRKFLEMFFKRIGRQSGYNVSRLLIVIWFWPFGRWLMQSINQFVLQQSLHSTFLHRKLVLHTHTRVYKRD